MHQNQDNTIGKKEWECPELQDLNMKKTESGTPYSDREDTDGFNPDISPQ